MTWAPTCLLGHSFPQPLEEWCGPHGYFSWQFYPQGYPEALIQHLNYFFLEVTPHDIHKWNVTSLETVKSLLKVSKGRKMDAQVTTCWEGSTWYEVVQAYGVNTGCEVVQAWGIVSPCPKASHWLPPTGGCPDCPLSGRRGPAR